MSMGLSARSSAGKRPGPGPFEALLVGKRPFLQPREASTYLWGNRPCLASAGKRPGPCPREALLVGNRPFLRPSGAPPIYGAIGPV